MHFSCNRPTGTRRSGGLHVTTAILFLSRGGKPLPLRVCVSEDYDHSFCSHSFASGLGFDIVRGNNPKFVGSFRVFISLLTAIGTERSTEEPVNILVKNNQELEGYGDDIDLVLGTDFLKSWQIFRHANSIILQTTNQKCIAA